MAEPIPAERRGYIVRGIVDQLLAAKDDVHAEYFRKLLLREILFAGGVIEMP